MAVVAMQAAGRDPSFAIGGSLNESGTNAHAGTDGVFVAEADESDRSFLAYTPDLAVVTNLELDHPEEFTRRGRRRRELRRVPATPRPGRAPPGSASTTRGRSASPDGTSTSAPTAPTRVPTSGSWSPTTGATGSVATARSSPTLQLAVPGRHNLLNATAALAVCLDLGIDPRGRRGGSDPVHRRGSPLPAARHRRRASRWSTTTPTTRPSCGRPWRRRAATAAGRVVLVVQPHRYSRTAVLGAELGRAAAAADVVIVTESTRPPRRRFPGSRVGPSPTRPSAAGANVTYVPHLTDVVDTLVDTGPGWRPRARDRRRRRDAGRSGAARPAGGRHVTAVASSDGDPVVEALRAAGRRRGPPGFLAGRAHHAARRRPGPCARGRRAGPRPDGGRARSAASTASPGWSSGAGPTC